MLRTNWLKTALTIAFVFLPLPCAATTFKFVPDPNSIVGVNSIWDAKVIVEPGFTSGSSTWDYYNSDPAGLVSIDAFPFGDLTPTGPYSPGNQDGWVMFDFTVSGDDLLGSFHLGGSEQTQMTGFSIAGEWLIGLGSDGPFCHGSNDPSSSEPGNPNTCRASGTFKKVAVPEPSSLMLLIVGIAGVAYGTRRRLVHFN